MTEPANARTSSTANQGSHGHSSGHAHGHTQGLSHGRADRQPVHDHGDGHGHADGSFRRNPAGTRAQFGLQFAPSAVRLGLAHRLAIAGAVCLMLWAAVLLVING